MKEEHDKLLHHVGRLQAVRHQIREQRDRLMARARAQRDSIAEVHDHVEAHVARDQGGGPLAYLALRHLQSERARLHHVLRDDDGGEPK